MAFHMYYTLAYQNYHIIEIYLRNALHNMIQHKGQVYDTKVKRVKEA